MFELYVVGNSLSEAYHKALEALACCHDDVPCPDYNTNQIEASMTMVVTEAIREPMISKFFIGGPNELEQYRQEMIDGILDFAVDSGKLEYTYHRRLENRIPWVIQELTRNPDSRRACITTFAESDLISHSPPCLQLMQFMIRQDKLHLKVVMRSNDAFEATFMNSFAFIMLQKYVGECLNVPVGSFTLRANSFHVYEKNYKDFWVSIRRIRDRMFQDWEELPWNDNLSYHYVGDWKDMMDNSVVQDMITAKMEELRNR